MITKNKIICALIRAFVEKDKKMFKKWTNIAAETFLKEKKFELYEYVLGLLSPKDCLSFMEIKKD